MKRIAISAVLLLLVGGFVVIATAASSGSAQGTYKIELDNAFGLVNGENFKVAGVVAGTIQSISLDPKNLHAVRPAEKYSKPALICLQDASQQATPQSSPPATGTGSGASK